MKKNKLYIVVNLETDLRDGVYRGKAIAQDSLKHWRKTYPQLQWKLVQVDPGEAVRGRHPHDSDQNRQRLQEAIAMVA